MFCPYDKNVTAADGGNTKKAENMRIFVRAIRKGICAASGSFVPTQQINKNTNVVPEIKPKLLKDVLRTAVLVVYFVETAGTCFRS